jgi:RNA binding exosome subunit
VKSPVQSVEVTYLVHATEDAGKIEGAVARLLGQSETPETESLMGHFGNVIIRARLHLTGARAGAAFEHILASMPRETADGIASDIAPYLDEHAALYLRLDKQRLVSGIVSIGPGDPVRVKIKPRAFTMKGGAAEFYLGFFGRRHVG